MANHDGHRFVRFLRSFAGTRAWIWFLTMVVLPFLHLDLNRMAFWILEVSLYANLESAWTNYQASRTEVRQAESDTGDDATND